MRTMQADNNRLASIHFTGRLTELNTFYAWNNNLTSIDLDNVGGQRIVTANVRRINGRPAELQQIHQPHHPQQQPDQPSGPRV